MTRIERIQKKLAAWEKQISKATDEAVKTIAAAKANVRLKEGHGNSFPFKPGAIVTITSNPNHHDYPLRKPLLVYKDDQAIFLKKGEWEGGNHLPDHAALYAPATDAQIAELLDNLDTFRGFPNE